MNLVAVMGTTSHKAALQAARDAGSTGIYSVDVMSAALESDAVTKWLRDIWDIMENAIDHAYENGIEAANQYIEAAGKLCGEAKEELKRHWDKVRDALSAKLDAYLHAAIDSALLRVRPTIKIGEAVMKIKNVKIGQNINMTGTIKASLTGLCEFVAKGELTLSTEYAAE